MSAEVKPVSNPRPRDLFLAALEIGDSAQRSAFLASACRDNASLRKRVEELLAEQEQIGTFLDTPALADQAPRPRAFEFNSSGPVGGSALEQVGDRIGRYKLLQQIGEGGCGAVYMAEQEEPVRRRVALKVIKAGMDTRSVIARFEAERQALAMMDHPNIAKVLDGGTTASGRPYFVMELVRGIRITQFCDENGLATRERLELFILVCHAIQHAHQKGIIHRDIKPSNVLVTLHDGVPVPKVIDFGIAKAIEQRLTDKTVFTAFDQFIGTPAYMSPEQAEMSGLDIDTRSDLYSLGVLLYELLTSKTPFDGKELAQCSLEEMRRTIREKEPVPPSTRLRTLPMADATDLVSHRREELRSLVKVVRGDLDWIVMKAMSKDRTQRFETAEGLAMDIEHYLNGEPVTARPPSRAYRLQKFVHRNRLLVTTGASIVAILIFGIAISTWQAVRAVHAEREQRFLLRVANTARQRESNQHQRAEDERAAALRQAYNSDMNVAHQALLANNYGRVVDLLNRHRHKPAPEPRTAKLKPDKDLRQWEWRYFWNQVQSDAAFAFPKQSNSVAALAISPDGKLLLSGDRQGTVKLWDLFRRVEIATIRESHGGGPFGGGRFVFAPTGDRLALAFSDRPWRTIVKVVSSTSRETVGQATFSGSIQGLTFTPDGNALLLYSEDQGVKTWDFASVPEPVTSETHEPPRGLRGPRGPGGPLFARATFSPDTRWLAVAEGGRVRLIETATGTEKTNLVAFEQGIGAVAFSPNNELLAVGPLLTEVDTDIKLFDVATAKVVGKFTGHVSWVPSLVFTADGKRLVSGGGDQTIRTWDVQTREETATLRGHFSEVNCIAVAPDGRTIVSGCKDGTLYGWDAEQRERKKAFETLPGQFTDLEFLPDGRTILTVGNDGTIALWDAATLQERERITDLGRGTEHVLLAADGTRLYASAHRRGLQVYDLKNRVLLTNAPGITRGEPFGIPLASIHGGRTLITIGPGPGQSPGGPGPGSGQGQTQGPGPGSGLHLWDTVTGQFQALSEAGTTGRLMGGRFDSPLAVSPDDGLVAFPGPDRTIDLTSLATGKKVASFNIETWGSSGLAFSGDGSLLAVAASDGTIYLCDVVNRTVIDTLRGHLLGVQDVAFSPDGERLASCSIKNDEAVKLWDLTSRHEVATLAGEGTLFRHLRFSPDGTLLAAINSQGKAHLWRAPALDEIERAERSGNSLGTPLKDHR